MARRVVRLRRTSVSLAVALQVILALQVSRGDVATESTQADFYIAPYGDDLSPGTMEKPFASLSRARDAVRGLRKMSPNRDIQVLLRGGTYRIKNTVEFSLLDSSADGHTITYAAYPGETPVLSSGVPIKGWRKLESPIEGTPAKSRGNVWSAPVPDELEHFKTLYDRSTRLPRARSDGFLPLDKAKSWRAKDQQVFRFPRGTLLAWPNFSDIDVVLVTAAPWTMNILPLKSVDEETQQARTSVAGTYALTQPRFGHFSSSAWVENTISALDQPGEWVLDSQKRRLYLWPKSGSPGDAIAAPTLVELIRVEGKINYDGPDDEPVRGLVFRGITFTQADRFTWVEGQKGWGLQHDWELFDRPTAMFRLRGAEECSIEKCHFVSAGATAIRLDLHCQDNRIDENIIEHVGGSGILLAGYGPGTKNVNRRNRVTRNRIHHIGELYWHSPAIFAWQSGENYIANNLIHHTPYSAIVVSGRIRWDRSGQGECSKTIRWNEVDGKLPPDRRDWYAREQFLHGRKNQIFRNEIHHAVEVLTDGNGIYISGAGRENTIRENFVHDCPSDQFAEGIRCDDDQHETTIDRNITWRLGGLATFICSKGKNHVTGNILACPLKPPARGMLSLEPLQENSMEGMVVKSNLFYATITPVNICYQGKNYYDKEAYLSECKADRNLYFNTKDQEWGKRHLMAEQERGSELNSISMDPLFVNPAEGDFRLQEESPAKDLGFEPIDQSLIGVSQESDG